MSYEVGSPVALADWYTMGHHRTYYSHFAATLRKAGHDVLLLHPEPEEAQRRAQAIGIGGTGGFASRRLSVPRMLKIRPSRLGAIFWTYQHYSRIERLVREWHSTAEGWPVVLFFACIYDRDFEWVRFAAPAMRLSWSGLYLHAGSFRAPGMPIPSTGRLPCPRQIFRAGPWGKIGLLDEGIAPAFASVTGRQSVWFPDISDLRGVTESSTALAERLRHAAQGRRVVLLAGQLQRSKGVLAFVRLAKRPEFADVLFAACGEILWWSFPADEQAEIAEHFHRQPNIWTHLAAVPDGPDFNAIIATADVIFAYYKGFPHSSNIMTKAAAARKPIVVADGYLMAERVRRYMLGAVAKPDDEESLAAALRQILLDGAVASAHWSDYSAAHSTARLATAIRELVTPPFAGKAAN